ncbi:hypothetical protein BJ741DRAFT_655774 [Chytriomyces cf. hyalinus JEL632]|nr:hypothetical protein BJ741DRAFT_655774 [Chytriomyces cf. hyalinus JEL632]
MVSFNLFQRGVLYFTVKGGNFTPLLKHGMDMFYYKQYLYANRLGASCQYVIFPLVCKDDFATEWTIFTELGCADVVALLTWIIIGFHTLISIYVLVMNCGKEKGSPDFLAGMESSCCGAGAVFVSLGAYDVEVEVHRKVANTKWRRAVRGITAIFQFVIIVFTCSAIRIVTGYGNVPTADYQRSSLFVWLFVLMLNLFTMTEHIFEGVAFGTIL